MMNVLPMEDAVKEMAVSLEQAIDGYGFRPTDEELIGYLKSKVPGWRESCCIIPTLENIYKIDPWDLPAKFNEKSIIRSKDQVWWFVCSQTQNQGTSRKTQCGSCWKINGKRTDIKARNDGKKVGSKVKFVFPDRRNSKGAESDWVMHELHPHPDNMGFVLCCLKKKYYEEADNQEPSIQKRGNQPSHVAMAKNGDIPPIPEFQHAKDSFSKLNHSKSNESYQSGTNSLTPIYEDNHQLSPNQEHLLWSEIYSSTANSSGSCLAVSEPSFCEPSLNVDVCSAIEAEEEHINQMKADSVQNLEEADEMSRTSKFIGEQEEKSCDGMGFENPEQLPFTEHQIQEMQNQLNELIMNGSSSSTEISSGSSTTFTEEWSRIEPWMSPNDRSSFASGELHNFCGLISEPEAEICVSQYGQLGERTNWDNDLANKNWRPGCPIQQGHAPLQEEIGFVQHKLSDLPGTGKIIAECASSYGVPAEATAHIHHPSQTLQTDRGKDIASSFDKSPTKSQIQMSSIIPWIQVLEKEPLGSIIYPESITPFGFIDNSSISSKNSLSRGFLQGYNNLVSQSLKNDEGKEISPSFEKSPTNSQIRICSMAPWTQIPEEPLEPFIYQEPIIDPTPLSAQAIELSSNPIPLASSGNKLKRTYSQMTIRPQAPSSKSRSRLS